MRSVIRVMVHYYAPGDHAPAHTYLGEAQGLARISTPLSNNQAMAVTFAQSSPACLTTRRGCTRTPPARRSAPTTS